MRKAILLTSFLYAMVQTVPSIAAPTQTGVGHIVYINGGWVNSNLRVQLADLPNMNPDGCPMADGYITDPSDPGNQLFNSMLLSAFMGKKRVRLTLDGCAELRPRIISVEILPD